jgi:ankyrin repeat protein
MLRSAYVNAQEMSSICQTFFSSPLIAACAAGREQMVQFLLSRSGVDVNNAAHGGHNPLFLPLQTIMYRLSHHGANPNQPNSAGWTPLMTAVYHGYA